MTLPIENEIVSEWLLESFPSAPCEENYISTCGSGPHTENDFDDFLRLSDAEIYDIDKYTDVLIVGRNFGEDEEDEELFSSLLELRKGKVLTVYSQEMFLAHWFTGRNPFDDEDVAKAFAKGHPALEFISSRWFDWASTTVNIGDTGGSLLNDAYNTGILKHMGYTVKQNTTLTTSGRREILTQVFSSQLPFINSEEYMKGWGQRNSKERLKKMADSIAFFHLGQKSKRNEIAASRYENDLGWLRETFYDGRFNFNWPQSYVD